MALPFTIDQFLSAFEKYNLAVWPAQAVLNLLAAAAIFLAIKTTRQAGRIIAIILAFFWFWTGLAYHIAFFAAINPAAYAFGMLCVAQGIVFLVYGVFTQRLSFRPRSDVYGTTGAIMMLYALILYPVLGNTMGHAYPQAPTFGLPCPTTIFTFGMLLWIEGKVPASVLVIPFLWSLVGFMAAVKLGILEDTGLLVAGIAGTILIILRNRRNVVVGA